MAIKSIYKITNNINGKCYIGQTNNVERRFREHCNPRVDADGTSKLLHQAIMKYGLDNFTFEVLESDIENYNEREQYWIGFYRSLSNENGYNIAAGGDAPPILRGYDNPNTTHSEEQVDKVIDLLLNTSLTTKEIGERTGYDVTAVVRINQGAMRRREELSYPLRKEITKDYASERALQIIEDLKNTTLTQKEIAEKYGVGRSTVTAINRGQNNKQPDLEYPIRSNKKARSVLMIDPAAGTILREFSSAEEASKTVGCSRGAIQACCSGNTKTSKGYCWKYKDE